jgi:ketol-acid reductoisomerase
LAKILENQAGRPVFNSLKRINAEHTIEVVGAQLRRLMEWKK